MKTLINVFIIVAIVLCITSLIVLIVDMAHEIRDRKERQKKEKQAEQGHQVQAQALKTDVEVEEDETSSTPSVKPEPSPSPLLLQSSPMPYMSGEGLQKTYTGDVFVDSLTAEEQVAFLNIFLEKRYTGVPAYRLREDNRKFFKKVWIHYCNFRDKVPESLSEKLCAKAEAHLAAQ